ncbi:active breakpoint cluster region-related protein-like, partial [Heptranchias perlo]|uniref:active breakpoint cluster region-related protein-like n=1 Tax=Heptranchias perlo TaxID=212740 RepID=UPI00355AC848
MGICLSITSRIMTGRSVGAMATRQRLTRLEREQLPRDRIAIITQLTPIRPLKAVAYTSQPVLTSQEIQTIFFKVSEVHEIHKDFFSKLKERTEGEEHVQPVGDLFQELVRTESLKVSVQVNQFGVYRAFINNYPLAVETAEKCIQSKEQFKQISQKMRLKPTKESKDTPTTTTLEVLLYKPLNHVTRVILSIRQLLDDTPRDHPDFCLLEKALNDSNCFLSMTNQTLPQKSSCRTCDASKDQHLVKDGFVVEVSENSRKLRHLFLSTNLLFSAKQKKISG